MIYVKRFIDKISLIESKNGKDFVMPIGEARGLRDELSKMLADHYNANSEKKTNEDPYIQIEMKGGSFK